jgi:hypothetical protein
MKDQLGGALVIVNLQDFSCWILSSKVTDLGNSIAEASAKGLYRP